MDPTYPKLNPLTRNPEVLFHDFNIGLNPQPELFTWSSASTTNTAKFLGRVATFASLPGYVKTSLSYRICVVENTPTDGSPARRHLLLGSRCGVLHSPHINARDKDSETVWCTHCWSDSRVTIPFYLYYRHYEDHIIDHLPSCAVCEKRFQIWEHDETLKEGHAYLFSAFQHPQLIQAVTQHLNLRAPPS
jgi:hypothetical protein